MHLVEVLDKKEEINFLETARVIYKYDDNWVCPLNDDIRGIFDRRRNEKFLNGDARRWVLKDDNDRPIGRIAAFVDNAYAASYDQPTGGIGFFECIEDQEAAQILFDTARQWLAQKGMEAMDGPINFGANDAYWGLLVDGFTPHAFRTPYHRHYYRRLFEGYGFKSYYHQYAFHLDINNHFPQRFWKIAEWISKKPEYEVKYFRFKDQDRFINDFVEIYNSTWPSFKEDFVPIDAEMVRKLLQDVRPVLVEEFNLFGYHKGRPIAFYVNLPDLNQIIRDFKGRLHAFNLMRFFYRVKFTKRINRLRSVIYGIAPKYRRSGIDAAIFWHLREALKKHPHYQQIELTWVGDFNPGMLNMWHRFNASRAKEYITYRYLFDRTRPFERYPIPKNNSRPRGKGERINRRLQ